jgi:hypothetical protein
MVKPAGTSTSEALMPTHLVAWIGRQHVDGARQDVPTGPIVDCLRSRPQASAVLLSDWPREEANQRPGASVSVFGAPLQEGTGQPETPNTNPRLRVRLFPSAPRAL